MFDLGKAFKAPFEDDDWISKTLLGLLWGILIVTSPAIYGAELEYIRRVGRGDESLPTWDDFGAKWLEGFLVSVAGILYFLPLIILGAIMLGPAMLAAIQSGGNLDAAASLAAGGTCLFILVAMVYGLAVTLIFNAAVVHFAMTRRFGAFFEFEEILRRVRGGTGYFTIWLYALVVSIAGSSAFSIVSATGIGAFLWGGVTYLVAMITGHLFGQWARINYSSAPAQVAPVPTYQPPTPV